MVTKYTFSKNEKKLIKELKEIGNTYNYSRSFDAFRNEYKEEINTFIDNDFLYHSNSGSEGAYVRYSVTSKGLSAFSQAE